MTGTQSPASSQSATLTSTSVSCRLREQDSRPISASVGFTPSPEAYAPSVATLELTRALLARYGVTRQEDLDLYVALVGGLIEVQLANDPGGQALAAAARPGCRHVRPRSGPRAPT
jgi:hypothetical protein